MNQFHTAYASVSCELRTPQISVANFTVKRMVDFIRGAHTETANVLHKVNTDKYRAVTDTDLNTHKKEIQGNRNYAEFSGLKAYCPTILAKHTPMLPFSDAMLTEVELAMEVVEKGSRDVLDQLDRYLTRPAELASISMGMDTLTTQLGNRIRDTLKQHEKLIDARGTKDARLFKELYPRMTDYYATVENAKEINNRFIKLRDKVKAYSQTVDITHERAMKLLSLIGSHPEKYKLGSEAASTISALMYSFAVEAEFVGRVLFNVDVFLKSIRDTNLVVKEKLNK